MPMYGKGVEKHRVYGGTLVSRGSLFLGGLRTNPLGWAYGPRGFGPLRHQSPAGRWGPPPAPRPPPAGLGAIARSEVRRSPPAGYYPLAAGRRLGRGDHPHPPPEGRRSLPRREGWGRLVARRCAPPSALSTPGEKGRARARCGAHPSARHWMEHQRGGRGDVFSPLPLGGRAMSFKLCTVSALTPYGGNDLWWSRARSGWGALCAGLGPEALLVFTRGGRGK